MAQRRSSHHATAPRAVSLPRRPGCLRRAPTPAQARAVGRRLTCSRLPAGVNSLARWCGWRPVDRGRRGRDVRAGGGVPPPRDNGSPRAAVAASAPASGRSPRVRRRGGPLPAASRRPFPARVHRGSVACLSQGASLRSAAEPVGFVRAAFSTKWLPRPDRTALAAVMRAGDALRRVGQRWPRPQPALVRRARGPGPRTPLTPADSPPAASCRVRRAYRVPHRAPAATGRPRVRHRNGGPTAGRSATGACRSGSSSCPLVSRGCRRRYGPCPSPPPTRRRRRPRCGSS